MTGAPGAAAPRRERGQATSADPPALVTVELFGVPRRRLPSALARMAADRRRLRRHPAVTFAKLLGTGDGRTFDVRDADLGTWGALVCWADRDAARGHAAQGPVAAGWRGIATEAWRAELRPLAARGAWSGQRPFGAPREADPAGPVAAVTRARLTPTRLPRFRRAVPPVVADLATADGLLLSLGIGEAPLGLLGTFSLWRDPAALRDFAYRRVAHRRVVAATPREGWYAEELFARLAVESSRGTVFGDDPLR